VDGRPAFGEHVVDEYPVRSNNLPVAADLHYWKAVLSTAMEDKVERSGAILSPRQWLQIGAVTPEISRRR
jgi:hypothetical protein